MTAIQWVGIVAVAALLFLAFGQDTTRVVRRRAQNYQVKYAQYINRNMVLQAGFFILLGVLMRDIILTPVLIALGLAIAYYRIRQQVAAAGKITVAQILQLALAFRAQYYLQPAAFASLQEAGRHVTGALRDLINVTVETFYLTSSTDRAFGEFRRRTDNMLLHQFMYILEMSESASNEAMEVALDAFVARLRGNEDLERQVETGLTDVTGQVRFSQGTIVVLTIIAALTPIFRNVWVTIPGRVGYMLIILLVVGVSYYIERQIEKLREQIQ